MIINEDSAPDSWWKPYQPYREWWDEVVFILNLHCKSSVLYLRASALTLEGFSAVFPQYALWWARFFCFSLILLPVMCSHVCKNHMQQKELWTWLPIAVQVLTIVQQLWDTTWRQSSPPNTHRILGLHRSLVAYQNVSPISSTSSCLTIHGSCQVWTPKQHVVCTEPANPITKTAFTCTCTLTPLALARGSAHSLLLPLSHAHTYLRTIYVC